MAASDSSGEKPTSTLFVRSLPFSTTDQILEDEFSQFGPLQQRFVVKDGVSGKCKGYGFVRFATWRDAQKAKESLSTIGGRKIQVNYSKPRVALKERKGMPSKKTEGERSRIRVLLKGDQGGGGGAAAGGGEDLGEAASPKKPSQMPFHFLISDLPKVGAGEDVVAELTPLFAEIPGFDKVATTMSEVGQSNTTVKICFTSKHLAMKAKKTLLKQKFRGVKLQLTSEAQAASLFANARKNRLIVRNLPFKIDEEGLKKAFIDFGSVQEVSIPKRKDDPKKMLGFGFVQFASGDHAAAALKGMNLSELLGRKIAVDWAVPKKQFENKALPASKQAGERDSAIEMDEDEDEQEDVEEEEEDNDSDSDDDSGSEEMKDDEMGDDDDEEADNSDEPDGSDDEEESDDNEDVEKTLRVDDFDREEWDRKKKVESGRDVEEGRTVFLRKVDFAVDENQLSEFFRQFGEVVLSRVVYDRSTGHSKGCAFVQFKTAEGAKNCLEEASENNGLRLGQQTMVVNLALPKKDAKQLTNEAQKMESKQPKDKRNLYLAREGFIRPGSDAAEGVSAADMNRRMKLVSLKKQKLKNTNFFISDTRLSVHNLPGTCDEKKLKSVFIGAVTKSGAKTAKVTECRIMRDGGRLIATKGGVGKSRGFGFVSFSSHEAALVALRQVNNNPDIFGEKKRLIVEFSVESSKALLVKEKRMEKIKGARQAREAGVGKKAGGSGSKSTNNTNEVVASSEATPSSHGGFQAQKGKPIQGLPKRLGAKMRHRERKGKGKGGRGGGSEEKSKTAAESKKSTSGERKVRKKKTGKGRKGDDKEERTFQNLVTKYKGGKEGNKAQKSGKKWDA